MSIKDDKFCPLPWIHLGTHPHGGVTPCCISDMTEGELPELDDALNMLDDMGFLD